MSIIEFWKANSLSESDFEAWITSVLPDAEEISAKLLFHGEENELVDNGDHYVTGIGLIEFFVKLKNGQNHVQRYAFETFEGLSTLAQERAHFEFYALEYIKNLEKRLSKTISVVTAFSATGRE